MKHTQGPWRIENNSSWNQIGNRLIIRADNPSKNLWDQICEVGIIHTGLMGGNPKANAQLIAAAPEMLNELIAIKKDLELLAENINTTVEDRIKIYQMLAFSINKLVIKVTGEKEVAA